MVPTLTYLDRYRNEGTRVYSRHAGYTEAQERYRPDSGHPSFDLPVFRLPREEVNVYAAGPSAAIREAYLPEGDALFCIHPQLLESRPDEAYLRRTLLVGTPIDPIPVSPSSSTRTLFVSGADVPHALKVHFPFRVSRYGRKMRDEVVEQAVTVSGELEEGIDSLDEGFAFLREVIGVTHRNLDPDSPRGENWGYLVREMTPFPDVPGDRSLIPGFALYGRDFFDSEIPPLIFELMGDAPPRDFLLDNVFLPIIRQWVDCFLSFGLVLEPHGQNVLLEMDGAGAMRRIVHRDLSVAIDMRRRRDVGRPDGSLNDYNRMETGDFNSIAYDKFMGGHFFERLVETIRGEYPSLAMKDLSGPCREEFARAFPHHEAYLPRTVRYFSEERDEFGKPLFRDTGLAPVWRP